MLETDEEIDEAFSEFIDILGIEKPVRWSWNKRAINRLGCAHLRDRWIELSKKTWKLASDKERREVVAHELAHIAAWDHHRHAGHGLWWVRMMIRAGYPEAKRCHSIDISKLTLHRKWPLFCDCTCHMVSKRYYNSVVNSTRRSRCVKCKGALRKSPE